MTMNKQKADKKGRAVPWNKVEITGGFWKKRMEVNRQVTLPAEYEQCKISGRVDSVKCIYRGERDGIPEKGVFTIDGVLAENMTDGKRIPRPHHYWDSDLAKWIEAASYALRHEPNEETERYIDSIVADFEALQEEDGYLNTYYTVVEPGKRWTNVYRMHELYCAGHLIEAAVAYYEATGKRRFLDIVCRYADCIGRTFGSKEGQIHGYPGHQEIELALIRLYRLTGEERYRDLASYFIDERGKSPHFFEREALENGRDVEDGGPKGILGKSYLAAGPYALFQAHLPVREQKTAQGHAVRLTYMGCAMADLALETGDASLWEACKRIWDNVTLRRMYVTGGVGSQDGCERFNFDWQLPNEEAYQETCASVGMVMWAYRMLVKKPDRVFGDVMERALYNGVLSGVSLRGDSFFYANHLAVKPEMFTDKIFRNPRMRPVRQKWFPVSCCPMNLARLVESIGGYLYTTKGNTVYVHLFADSRAEVELLGKSLTVRQETDFPWKPEIKITISAKEPVEGDIAVRKPGWSRTAAMCIDGKAWKGEEEDDGYLHIRRVWEGDVVIDITFSMEPILLEAHPYVRMNTGKAAIQAGPFIYCLEEADNGKHLETVFLDPSCNLELIWCGELLEGIPVIRGKALRKKTDGWEGLLYRPKEALGETFFPQDALWEEITVQAVPWFCFANREPGEMLVWINCLSGRGKDMDRTKEGSGELI